MNTHIEQNREKMFQDAVDEVKGKLRIMCRVVEEQMANKADEVRIFPWQTLLQV